MALAWLKARQTKYSAFTALYIAAILGILVLFNVFADRYDKSYDSTANKQFSLSDQTIKLAQGLKRDVQITYFGPQDEFRSARDFLDRYSALSPKAHVSYIDPDRKPQVAKAAGYRSDAPVMIDTGSRREGAKSLTEEEVTGALIRALKTGERTVCMLSAAGEHSIEDREAGGYSLFKELLERDNYKVRAESPAPSAKSANQPLSVGPGQPAATVEIGGDCTVLVVAGPRNDYPSSIVSAIERYVEGGGRALALLDTSVALGKTEPPTENAEFQSLLGKWGITVDRDLVLDLSGMGQLLGLGPEMPFILRYESHPITRPLTRIPTVYPLSRSLEIKSNQKATVVKLVATTENSVGTDSIGPRGEVDPRKGKKGPLTLVAAGTLSGTPQGRLVVVGTSLAAQNSLVGSRQIGNRDLMVNIVNWLSSDEDLISIRPKSREDRPLSMTSQRMQVLFWLAVVVLPLLVTALGFLAWWKRR